MTHSFSHYDQLARQSQTALYLYIDIETIPSRDPAVLEAIRAKHVVPALDLDAVKPDARLADPAKIQADIEKKRAKAVEDHAAAVARAEVDIDTEWRKTALDASTGHIASVSLALGDADIYSYYDGSLEAYGSKGGPEYKGFVDTILRIITTQLGIDERGMLEKLFLSLESMLENNARLSATHALIAADRFDHKNLQLEIQRHRQVPVVVAHHAGFDVRYIWQRAIVLGVTPPAWWPIDARPWDHDRIQDTMTMWAGHGNRIGLDRLCKALGLPGKTGVDGSQVWDLVQAGRIDEVVEYCDDDVRRLRSVHRKMLGLPLLEIDAIDVSSGGAEGEREAA